MERLVRYNEPEDGPKQRVIIYFEGSPLHPAVYEGERGECDRNKPFCVVLLNASFPSVEESFRSQLELLQGQKLRHTIEGRVLFFDMELPFVSASSGPPVSAYVLATNGKELVIPLNNSLEKSTDYMAFGIVITGKQYLNRKIIYADLLEKRMPTPFAPDAEGDSWNDSFYKEPRIIERYPETVIRAVKDLQRIAKKAYQRGSYSLAAKKYRKAFHYCHSYFPDELDNDDLAEITTLKLNSMLNLSLASVKAGDLNNAIKSANFALEMPEIEETPLLKAKSYYRRGCAYLAAGDDKLGLSDFEKSNALWPDPSTKAMIRKCHNAFRIREEKLRLAIGKKFK